MADFPTTYVNHHGATVSFPRPSKPIGEGVKTNNLIISFDANNEQRRKKSNPRYTFDLTFPLLEKSAYEALRTFYITTCSGNLNSFNWTHPITKTVYVVRFDSDTWTGEYHMTTGQSVHYYKTQIKLITIL